MQACLGFASNVNEQETGAMWTICLLWLDLSAILWVKNIRFDLN